MSSAHIPRRRRYGRLASAMTLAACSVPAGATTPFTLIALPDTQYYTQTTENNELYFKGQTRWIVNNRSSMNIAFVMGLGDIQNDGNPYWSDGDPTGFVNDEHEWVNADAAIKILDDAGVPYALAPGNHDYVHHDIKQEPILYLKWFGPQRYANKPTFGGASPILGFSPAGMNSYHKFDAGGYKFLNIVLQYAPDAKDLAWAQRVINDNPGLPTIVTMHAMLDTDGYQAGREIIFTQFAANNPQVVMMMNGHVNGAFRQAPNNIAGVPVNQMLVDYQSTEYPGLFKGGGYLRQLQWDVDANVVHVKSYSPVANNYLTDSLNQFDLNIDLKKFVGPAPGVGPTNTKTFRQGVANYTGTKDAQIDATVPGTPNGSAGSIWVDGNVSDNLPRQGLIRFDGIIGAGAVPLNAAIESATLTLHTATSSNAQSPNIIGIYRLLKTWDPATATWNSMVNGITADGTEAILAATDTVAGPDLGQFVTFDVTESLVAWAAGAPNFGWAVMAPGSDGWLWDSSETGTSGNRPLLSVKYRTYAAPGDANGDGVISQADYIALMNGYNAHMTGWNNGDFNNDGRISSDDFAIFALARANAVAAEEAVPEPGTLAALLVPAALWSTRRRTARR